jgi:hypothetical protein
VLLPALWPAAARPQSVEVTGEPYALVVATAVPGWSPDPVTDDATTYRLSDVGPGSRLRARLLTALPEGVTVEARAASPTGAQSEGWVVLDAAPRTLVFDIPAGSHDARVITYRLTTTTGVAPALRSFTVLFEVDS